MSSRETQHREVVLEDEITAHLKAHGWLYSADGKGYDKELALFPEDVLGWLRDSQPDEYEKIVRPTDSPEMQRKSEWEILERLQKALDKDPMTTGGSLRILRRGFDYYQARAGVRAKFKMAQVKPATTKNPSTVAMYEKMRVRVVRQVHYSSKYPAKSLDLVLFVNGIPVATVEVKTDFTQSASEAIAQFREDRPVRGEPLFQYGARALVHFVVSNSLVFMTTKLDGAKTRFLPFNRGDDGGAGNPLNPDGSPTSYFWEETLQKDTWLDIVLRFIQVEGKKKPDPKTGRVVEQRSIIFPRYHQWRAVTRLVAAARAEGPGHRYLIQHSAGSGKSNSIAWLAHRLSNLHDAAENKVFDTVIVVTDRTVLDDQLQDTIYQFEHTSGVVVPITREGAESKSTELTRALTQGAKIIIVTIQTFLPTIALIQGSEALAGRSFAVIADEAHSSQTGVTATAVKKVLSPEEQDELEDGGSLDSEAYLAAVAAQTASSENISFFAFTATPKPKTIELFGRYPDSMPMGPGNGIRVDVMNSPRDVRLEISDEYSAASDGGSAVPRAFDIYSMQQAIEEGFILDVLRNYTPYETAWRLAHPDGTYGDSTPVDESQARKALVRWVQHNPTTIWTKVGVIIEHFREHVAHHLNGEAKAMVVTSSRKQAVRYKTAFDKYIKTMRIADVKALVAFSGTVDDTGPDGVGEGLTESNMNPGIRSGRLAEEFDGTTYNVMIVANKFQTGFDQPKLVAMYVDKRLDGVQAVQTLSRLNRIYPGKTQTFVLDFVNDPQKVLEAFQVYYREAQLTDVSDPNQVTDIAVKLDTAGIYAEPEFMGFADAWVNHEGNNALIKWTAPAVKRFAHRWKSALLTEDLAEQERLLQFKGDVGAYVRYYDFISQILDLDDTDLLRRQLFYRAILPQLSAAQDEETVDISLVTLDGYRLTRGDTVNLELSDGPKLDPISAVGSGIVREKHRDKLEEIIRKLNDRYADQFGETAVRTTIGAVITTMADDDDLADQAMVNTEDKFPESSAIIPAFLRALLGVRDTTPAIIDGILADDRLRKDLSNGMGALLYDELRKRKGIDDDGS